MQALPSTGPCSAVSCQSTLGAIAAWEVVVYLSFLRPEQISAVMLIWAVYTVPPSARLEDHWGREGVFFLVIVFLHSLLLFLAQEEGDDCILGVHRRLHNSLERSELPAKQGLPESGRARAEERFRPARPCAEDN